MRQREDAQDRTGATAGPSHLPRTDLCFQSFCRLSSKGQDLLDISQTPM